MRSERCTVCEGPLTEALSAARDPESGEVFRVLRCTRCGLGHTVPHPVDLTPYYGVAYFGGRHGASEKLCMARRVRFLKALAPGRRLLDFGCGDGGFLVAAAHAGFDVVGVDAQIAHASAKGVIAVESLEQVQGLFDAITLWHSLEHVSAPVDTMRRLVSLLAENGALIVAVPNFASLQARCFGADWFHLDVPRHLHHFTRLALNAIFSEVGLRPVDSLATEGEIDLFGWIQSLLNCVFRSHQNVLFDVITRRQKAHDWLIVSASLVLGAITSLIAAPLVAIASGMNQGAVLVIAARKA